MRSTSNGSRVRAGARSGTWADIRSPIVGFSGGIDDYVVDLDLLKRVAQELPGRSLVLIGDATCPIHSLLSLPNVHWLGFGPYK